MRKTTATALIAALFQFDRYRLRPSEEELIDHLTAALEPLADVERQLKEVKHQRYMAGYMASRRAQARAAGVCVDCGGTVKPVEPPKDGKRRRGRPPGGARCAACREIIRLSEIDRVAEKARLDGPK